MGSCPDTDVHPRTLRPVFLSSSEAKVHKHSTIDTFYIPTGENFAWSLPIPLTACILRSNS